LEVNDDGLAARRRQRGLQFPSSPNYAHICDHFYLDCGYEDLSISSDYRLDLPESDRERQQHISYLYHAGRCKLNHCLVKTDSGFKGSGPYLTRPGDVVVVILGGAFCVMLRPHRIMYRLLGEVDLQGAMQGELIKNGERETIIGLQMFDLC
jgi:hypothetical protein